MPLYDLDKLIESKIHLYSKGVSSQRIKILISYSGGVDSSVLLYIVNKLSTKIGFELSFVYINHKMNPNDKNIRRHCEYLANNYGSSFIYKEIEAIPTSNKESFLRNYRYKCIKKLCNKHMYDFVFTGHHFDDQLETIFMRASGNYDWTNLFGIYEFNGLIRRPMLKIKKYQIVKYAIRNNIVWFFDYSNNDSRILRNNIRINIFPNKNGIYFYYLRLLLFTSQLKLSLSKYRLSRISRVVLKKTDDYILMDKNKFLKLNNAYRKMFFQKTLKAYNDGKYLMLRKKQWLELWNYLEKKKNLGNFLLNNYLIVNNSKDLIILMRSNSYTKKVSLKDNAIWEDYVFRLESSSRIDSGSVLDRDLAYIPEIIFKEGVYIRNWINGDSYLSSNLKKKKVSKLFIKNKFNNYQKMTHPIFVDSRDQIIWIPDLLSARHIGAHYKNNNYIKISKEILN